MLVPGLDGPVDTDLGQWVSDMFHDMSRWKRPRPRQQKPQGAAVPASAGNGADMAALVQPIARRALLARPRTTAEIDKIVAQMQHMGLNQLWLTVFTSDGARVA